jgi:hypothetical protein
VIETGTMLIECEEAMPQGKYLLALELAGYKPRKGQMYACVANNPILTDAQSLRMCLLISASCICLPGWMSRSFDAR